MSSPNLSSEAARALNAKQFEGMTSEQVSTHMAGLARLRAAKLSPSKRRKIAAAGGRAIAGKERRPGAGRPRKTKPADDSILTSERTNNPPSQPPQA